MGDLNASPSPGHKDAIFSLEEDLIPLKSQPSTGSQIGEKRAWIVDEYARESLFSSFTCSYALTLMVLGLILELSHLLYEMRECSMEKAKDAIFSLYMYGGSIVFLMFCYAIFLNASWSRKFVSGVILARQKLAGNAKLRKQSLAMEVFKKASHSNPSTGSLYLRLGCVVFGIFGVVYYGLTLITGLMGWAEELNDCRGNTLLFSGLATVFIFAQTHFIFCNSKIMVHGYMNVARLGMMHLVATNLWTWIRYILIEESKTNRELEHANWGHHNHNVTTAMEDGEKCVGASCMLGNFSEFMYTCVVEYSLICAGITFIFWRKIGRNQIKILQEVKHKRKNVISVDCSKTSTGLFFGFLFISCTLICIALFNAYIYNEHMSNIANWIFFLTDALIFLTSITACVYALYRMRYLNFASTKKYAQTSEKLLDEILLTVGLIGEMVFSFASLVALTGNIEWTYVTGLLLVVMVLRVVQVFLQTALLRIGTSLKANTNMTQEKKPGKQVITFLLIANIALFLMNIFEAQKAGLSAEVVRNYGNRSWALLVRGSSPLIIFYRFHSSVCFAEIWKNSYRSPIRSRPSEGNLI